MLELTIPENEVYIPMQNKFISIPASTVILEHSLISLAKWESKWKIPYLGSRQLTFAQELDYVRCMVIGQIKNDLIFTVLPSESIKQIRAYIDDPMTATTLSKKKNAASKKVITAEVIYCRMFANNIPMECQKWHLNRLLTLIQVCEESNNPPQKMSKKETAMRNAELNAARRAKFNTRG